MSKINIDGYKYHIETVTAATFLAMYKPYKNQGELNEKVVEGLRGVKLIPSLTSPSSPVVIANGLTIATGNSRREALHRDFLAGTVDKDLPINLLVLDVQLTEQELALLVVHGNFGAAQNRKRQQTALNPAFALSRKIFIPVHKAIESTGLKGNPRIELAVKLGTLMFHYPQLTEKISRTRRASVSGTSLYMTKTLLGAKAMDVCDVERVDQDLRNDERFIDSIEFASRVVGELFTTIDNDFDRQDLIGSTRTTFFYVVFAAALSGRLRRDSLKKVVANLSKNRKKVKDHLKAFPNHSERSEDGICDLLGIGPVEVDSILSPMSEVA